MNVKKKDKVNFKSIKFSLILFFSFLIILSSITIGFISLKNSTDVLTVELEETIRQRAVDGARLVQSRIETQRRMLDMIALGEEIQGMDWEIQQPVLKDTLSNTNFLDFGVVHPNGTAYYTDGTTAELGDREYIKKALNGQSNVSDLLISRVTNNVVLMFATPIKQDGQVVGALIGRRDGNSLSNMVNFTGIGNQGYGYIIDRSGTFVGHQDRKKVLYQYNPIEEFKKDESLESLANVTEKMITEGLGISEYSLDGQDLYAGYSPIEGTNWIYVHTA